jgi:hypothetical protein
MLASGIGAFTMGLIVVLNEAGLFAVPALYGPAGGVSGRTTFATLVWLVAWGVLHARWKARELEPGRVFGLTLVLIGAGIPGTLPPLWSLLQSGPPLRLAFARKEAGGLRAQASLRFRVE